MLHILMVFYLVSHLLENVYNYTALAAEGLRFDRTFDFTDQFATHQVTPLYRNTTTARYSNL